MDNQDKIRAARAAYAREYRKRNPEKIKAAQERYWLKKLEIDKEKEHENEDRP